MMKTAISIPDPLFEAAEYLARRLGVSRSELFARAVAEYLEHHKYQDVTEALNALYAQEKSAIDKELVAMQIASLPEEKW